MRTTALAATIAALVAGQHGGLRVFDPTHATNVEVTSADLVRGSVHAGRTANGAAVDASLTAKGEAAFCALTRALARRGARLRRVQHFAVAVDGRIQSRPSIDYRAFPRGLCGSPQLEIDVPTLALARTLANEIEQGRSG